MLMSCRACFTRADIKTRVKPLANGGCHVVACCGNCGAHIKWLNQREKEEARKAGLNVDTSADTNAQKTLF